MWRRPMTARRHGRDLIPRLAATLREAGVRARDIEVIAVGLGPGSYTGLRVGLTAAKALAYATGASVARSRQPRGHRAQRPGRAARDLGHRRCPARAALRGRIRPGGAAGPLLAAERSQIEPLRRLAGSLEPGTVVLGPGLQSPRIRSALPVGLVGP